MIQKNTHWKHWPLYCLAVTAGFAAVMGINPGDRFDWFLENILTVLFLILLLWSYKHFRLSNVSYTLITIFLMLHTIGSHYTYASAPIGWWIAHTFGFMRNHFDRVVHFSFGLLLAYPIREVFLRIASARGFWGYYLPFDVTMSLSAIYEIIEWIAAATLNPSQGSAFLGSQGDEFDAIKDMGMAGLGALIAMTATALIDMHLKPEFWKELKVSCKVKHPKPLGEVTYEKYARNKKKAINTLAVLLFCLSFFTIAMASASQAQDIEILVDGKPLAEGYAIKPGQQIEVTTKIDAGVLIKEIRIDSNNPLLQEIIGHAFDSADFHRDAVEKEFKSILSLPGLLPSGATTLDIEIRYDKDFNDKEFNTKTVLTIEGGSRTMQILSKLLTEQAATELSNWLTGYNIPRSNPELTMDDLTKSDLTELGITNDDYIQTIALVKEANELMAAGKKSQAEAVMAASQGKLPVIKETSSTESNPQIGELKVKSPKSANELDGPISPAVTMTAKTYTVTARDKTITKSKIMVSVSSPKNEGISNVETVVFVPKEIAKISKDIDFRQRPIIIDPDPVVKWAFKNIPQDQVKDYTFTVNKDVQNFEVLAGATAERPSFMFRVIKWILEKFITKNV